MVLAFKCWVFSCWIFLPLCKLPPMIAQWTSDPATILTQFNISRLLATVGVTQDFIESLSILNKQYFKEAKIVNWTRLLFLGMVLNKEYFTTKEYCHMALLRQELFKPKSETQWQQMQSLEEVRLFNNFNFN